MKKVHGLFDCVQEKRCRKCCVIKPLDQFYDQPRPNGGKTKTSRCIECLKPQMAAYRASHRNRLNQYHKDYYRSNRLENRKKIVTRNMVLRLASTNRVWPPCRDVAKFVDARKLVINCWRSTDSKLLLLTTATTLESFVDFCVGGAILRLASWEIALT